MLFYCFVEFAKMLVRNQQGHATLLWLTGQMQPTCSKKTLKEKSNTDLVVHIHTYIKSGINTSLRQGFGIIVPLY